MLTPFIGRLLIDGLRHAKILSAFSTFIKMEGPAGVAALDCGSACRTFDSAHHVHGYGHPDHEQYNRDEDCARDRACEHDYEDDCSEKADKQKRDYQDKFIAWRHIDGPSCIVQATKSGGSTPSLRSVSHATAYSY
jgi:hypothetical protein